LRGAAIALGNFDGLHKGHRAVVSSALDAASGAKVPGGVMMFDPPPYVFFQPDLRPRRIMSIERRVELLGEMGADFCLAIPFDARVAEMTDEDFCQHILVDALGVSSVSVGFDFFYGRNRMGDVDSLRRFGDRFGFEVHMVEKVAAGHEAGGEDKASSTRVRECIGEGRMEDVARMIHGYWRVSGNVEHGEQRGRTIGFPTANLGLREFHHPRYGVYAVWARIEGEDVWRNSVASFGRTPTTGLRDPLLEVVIFDWSGDLYGKRLDVAFGTFLRPEEKFDSLEALIAQMDLDCDAARKWLARADAPN